MASPPTATVSFDFSGPARQRNRNEWIVPWSETVRTMDGYRQEYGVIDEQYTSLQPDAAYSESIQLPYGTGFSQLGSLYAMKTMGRDRTAMKARR